MSAEEARSPRPDHWMQIVTTMGVMVIVGILGWLGLQLVGMRDDIHTLKDTLPGLEARITRLEARQDKVIDVLAARVLQDEGT
jgi:hypothetical protein